MLRQANPGDIVVDFSGARPDVSALMRYTGYGRPIIGGSVYVRGLNNPGNSHDISKSRMEDYFAQGFALQANCEQKFDDVLRGADYGRRLADAFNVGLAELDWPKSLMVPFSFDVDIPSSGTISDIALQFMMGWAERFAWPLAGYGGTKFGNRCVREGVLPPGTIWKAMASSWSSHESDENCYLLQQLGYVPGFGQVDWNIVRLPFYLWLGGPDNVHEADQQATPPPKTFGVEMSEYVCNAEVRHFENQDWPIGWLYYEMTFDPASGQDVKRRVTGPGGPGRHLNTAIPLTNQQLDLIPDWTQPAPIVVNTPAPVVTGGVTRQEVEAVVTAKLNATKLAVQ